MYLTDTPFNFQQIKKNFFIQRINRKLLQFFCKVYTWLMVIESLEFMFSYMKFNIEKSKKAF